MPTAIKEAIDVYGLTRDALEKSEGYKPSAMSVFEALWLVEWNKRIKEDEASGKQVPMKHKSRYVHERFAELKAWLHEVAKELKIELPERFDKYLYKVTMEMAKIPKKAPGPARKRPASAGVIDKKPQSVGERTFSKRHSGRVIPKQKPKRKGRSLGDLLEERGQQLGKGIG